MPSLPLLSAIIWLPVIAGILLWILSDRFSVGAARAWSLIVTAMTLALTLLVYAQFDITDSEFQFVEQAAWIPQLAIEYYLAIDGLSLLLILLTAIMMPIALLIKAPFKSASHVRFLANFLILEGLMIGVFAAQDGILFYLFWEAMLVPMFLIIGIWGSSNRVYATIKFFLYTLLGSLLMLVALLYLYRESGSFAILDWYDLPLGLNAQVILFLAFLSAFAVKIPMFPVHTWLPDAHTEAPTAGSVILAAIMLKMGAYGLLRFNLPIFPDAVQQLALPIVILSLIAIVYIAWVALVQIDIKRLIAYSSIAHMGFVTLGMFLLSAEGIAGGIIQMISHGFTSGALFICAGIIYDRLHTRKIADFGGIANAMPSYAMFFVLFAMANVGLPGTSGFVGEFLVILSAFQNQFWIAVLAATTLVFGAVYSLWLVRRVIFGKAKNETIANLKDITVQERIVLSLLAIAVIGIGVYPAILLDTVNPYVDQLTAQLATSKI